MVEKLRNVKIDTEKGERILQFRPVESLPDGRRWDCDTVCPYGGKICRRLIDPRNPNDPNSDFMNFCSDLGEDENADPKDKVLQTYIPVKGTLEENLYDIGNFYKTLIEKNGFVRITDVIDGVCSDTCPMWNKEHSKCSPSNGACILQDLLKNQNYDPSAIDQIKEEAKSLNGEDESDGF